MNRNLISRFFALALIMLATACGNRASAPVEEEVAETDSIVSDSIISKTSEEETNQKQSQKSDGLEGSYYCSRSRDTYTFHANGEGEFLPDGAVVAYTFRWNKIGDKVVASYYGNMGGNTTLKYDKKKDILTENSESFGKLVFEKEG